MNNYCGETNFQIIVRDENYRKLDEIKCSNTELPKYLLGIFKKYGVKAKIWFKIDEHKDRDLDWAR